MINVDCTSQYMNAYGTSSGPYIGSNPNNPVQGMLRYQNGNLEVFDGSGWARMIMDISVGLDAEGEQAIAWALERMEQERRWTKLAEQHPAVADAIRARDKAEKALAVVSRLCGELET
jgi:hypothetical protein